MFKCVIIGCGNIAGGYDLRSSGETVMTHAKAFRTNPSTTIVGAYDISLKRATDFSSEWNIPAAYDDLQKMMKECAPDIVSICSPNATHFDTFEKIADFNPKAVICEKPIALRLDHARKMVDRAARANIRLAINYQRRWDSALTSLGCRITEGEFGDLRLARVIYTKGLLHNASHMINLLQAWAGNLKSSSVQKKIDRPHGDLIAHFKLDFERCPDAFFQAVNADDFNTADMDLFFSKARVHLPGAGTEIRIQRAEPSLLMPGTKMLGTNVETIPGTFHLALGKVIDNVVETILGKAELVMSPMDALRTLEICEEVKEKSI